MDIYFVMTRVNGGLLALITAALIGAAGCTHPSPVESTSASPKANGTSLPTVMPLPTAPPHVDFAKLSPRINEDTPCDHLALPGYYWETLRQPDCWNEDFGNVHFYAEDYSFIVGWRVSDHAPFLIYNQPNGVVHARRMPGDQRLRFESVRVTDLCLSAVGSTHVVATFDWRTRRLTNRAVAYCR